MENYQKIKALLRKLYLFNFRFSLIRKIVGIDFGSCFEYPTAIIKLDLKKGDKLLDIGSLNSCLPLFFVKKGINVTLMDIDKRVYNQKRYQKKVKVKDNFNLLVGDARKTKFKKSTFDAITCISTIEHIPEDGDIKAIKEFYRILKPGGKIFISVPYCQKYNEGKWGRWFERHYDYEALKKRLIKTTKFKLIDEGFFLDKNTRKFSNIIYYKLPKLLRFLFMGTYYFFAKHYIPKDKATKNDAWIAWILLKK